jgi:hypothetical protein
MKKVIKITESQLNQIVEKRSSDYSAIEVANFLKDIECTGESVKSIVQRKLSEYGFEDIIIKFLSYGDNPDDLKYIVYTEGPIFTFVAKSRSEMEPPCMDIIDVIAFTKA